MQARKAIVAAKTFAVITARLGRATGRPDTAARFAARFLAGDETPVTFNWHGLEIAARGADWFALQEVLIEREYEALLPFLAGAAPPVVLDLGANIGAFATFLLANRRDAVVHSYEPAATTCRLLARNAMRNPGVDWRTVQAAAWSCDGSIAFTGAAASTAGHVAAGGGETVPALSLASIIARAGGRIDLAKIDIEGAEEALLAGRASELALVETVAVELHPDRCDASRVAAELRQSYGTLYRIPGRRSSKPLVLATRAPRPPALPLYTP